jgi:hypothetical protein
MRIDTDESKVPYGSESVAGSERIEREKKVVTLPDWEVMESGWKMVV